MARCQIKTGFMVLRDCENSAEEACAICGKFVCLRHKRNHPQTQQVCCIDCYAKTLDDEAVKNEGNINTDENHCCCCGKSVFSKRGKNAPDNKVLDPDTKKVYCQDCYDNMTEDGNVQRTVGTALLGTSIYEDDYWYGYRSRYYHRNHYRPFRTGINSSDFDDSEIRAFNPQNNPQENGNLDNIGNDDNVFDS